jgi:hypothetical protein
MRLFVLCVSLCLYTTSAWAADQPAPRKYTAGPAVFKEVLRDKYGSELANKLLTRPVRKQLNRMTNRVSKLDVADLSLDQAEPKPGEPKPGAERSVYNTPVGLVASTRTKDGKVVNRGRVMDRTRVRELFEVGSRVPRLLRGVPGSESLRRGDKVYYQHQPDGSVRVNVTRDGRDSPVLEVVVAKKGAPASL